MIYLGDNELLGVKLGNDDIAGIYVGDNLIYPTTVTAWSVSPAVIEVESGSSTERIKIAALDSWTITSNKSWITFSQNSGDSGRTTVIATIAQNDTMDRTATITIEGGDGYIATISVSQEAAPYENQYLTVEALESGNFDIGAIWPAYVSQGLSNLGASYSLNEGAWVAIPDTGTTIQGVSVGDRIRLKAQNVYGIGAGLFRPAGDTPVSIRFNAYGNVMSALYGDNFAGQDTFPTNMLIGTAGALDSAFYSTNVVDASNLIMPATALTWGCYMNMFLNCPNLTGAPELPATILADSCYNGLFRGCSSLNYIKCLATDISATDCTNNWVNGVAATGTFVKSHSMSGWTTGYDGIPTGWEVEDDCDPLVLSDNLGNTNNQGKTYGNRFYLFDSGVTDITPCEYNFFGIQSICVRPDAFFTGTKVASFGVGGDGCATTLKNAIIDCSGVSCVNFSFGSDRITYSSLTSVEMYNTDNVTWFGNFVYWCPNVESVKLGNLSNVTNTSPGGRIFGPNNTAKLTVLEIDGLPDANLTSSVWGFSYLTNLTVNSLLSILNALPTTTNNRTIVLGAENIAKLTAEQLAIATNKGWSVVPA